MDLTKIKLPDTITVSGVDYPIQTGHTYWFRFSQLLDDINSTFGDFDFLYIDEKPENRQEGFTELFNFYYEKKEIPRVTDESSGVKAIDYTVDADLLYAGLLQQYGVDLSLKNIHWHKVRAMIAGLKETKLNDIIYYRTCDYDAKQKELMKAKTAWALPEKEDNASKELEEFNALFD